MPLSVSHTEKHPRVCQQFQLVSQTLCVDGLTSTNTFVTSTSEHVSSRSPYIRPADILIILNHFTTKLMFVSVDIRIGPVQRSEVICSEPKQKEEQSKCRIKDFLGN